MATQAIGARIVFRNVLLLTDFSEPSEAALPFAVGIVRAYGAKLYAFHVLLPAPSAYLTPESTVAALESEEERAQEEMRRLESQISGLRHEIAIERDIAVWPPLEQAIAANYVDLLVLGTHGRTGAQKLLLGSVAEEIFRRAEVPVLTIGPGVRSTAHNDARFRRILFATDFSTHSLAAWPHALSLAQENQARLLLLHVDNKTKPHAHDKASEDATQQMRSDLEDLIPVNAAAWFQPEIAVERGDPRVKILDVATDWRADLIVLGVRSAAGRLGAATHLDRATAHNIVAHATCPVLTVRGHS
jgi:nucleotide-binding universal stress UspA family protein